MQETHNINFGNSVNDYLSSQRARDILVFFSCSGSTYRRRRLHLTVKKCIKPVQAEQYVHLFFFYLLHFSSFLKTLFVTVFGVFFFSRVRPGGTKLIHEKIVVEKAQRQHPIFIMEL